MNKFYFCTFFIALLWFTSTPLQAQDSTASSDAATLDQIVAVVNDHIILKSEVDERVRQTLYQMQRRRQQRIKFDDRVWYSTLRGMVEQYVMLDQAKVDSVTVTDTKVDQEINNRIDQIVQQVGSREALEEQLGKSILEIRTDLREQYRQDLIIQEYRRQKIKEIKITRPEVKAFFESIPEDSLPTIPERVAISQIVAIPPPNKDARQEAYKLAKALRDSILNHGKTIEELAKKYSDAPRGDQGGKLPMISIDQLVPEYSAAAAALEPGEISQVVETSFGFHVIRLNERQGDKIDTNHILIEIDEDSYNDEQAIAKLKAIRDSIITKEKLTFAEAARKKSEDSHTGPRGGKVLHPESGARMLQLEQLDPALYRIVLLLDEGEISEPKPFTVGTQNNAQHAYRIVRVDKHVPSHVANLKDDYERIKQSALQQKRVRILRNWIAELKEEVYINYRIPMPEQLAQL